MVHLFFLSNRYYGNLQAAASHLLGNAPHVENIYDYTPSVLELAETSVRDPAFYQLNKKVIDLYKHYQNSLPPYQYNDLVLPGVTIQSVVVSPLTTFFDEYYVSLDQAAVLEQGQGQGQEIQSVKGNDQKDEQEGQQQGQNIQAKLMRLDHHPYNYQITVQSQKHIPGAVVRVYLGPKYDDQGQPISISQHRQLFVELDQFVQDRTYEIRPKSLNKCIRFNRHSLRRGRNNISRVNVRFDLQCNKDKMLYLGILNRRQERATTIHRRKLSKKALTLPLTHSNHCTSRK